MYWESQETEKGLYDILDWLSVMWILNATESSLEAEKKKLLYSE